ncbi:cystathionine gamma-lyase cys3 [Kickxella alabastrina]|nr:cystathionine gamma-lyase cys3 [Kickxella alabastrina]
MRGFGGMVSFRIKGDTHTADRFLQRTHLFTLAESLGGVESLAELPARMTHAGLAPEERLELGITDNLIRLSVGVEDADDLLADIAQALRSAVAEN